MKKNLTITLLLAVLLLLLPACGNDKLPDGPTELWVVTEKTTQHGMNDQAERIIRQFEAIYENVSVRLDILPTGKEERAVYLDSLRTQIMAGGGPDLYLMPTDNYVPVDGKDLNAAQRVEPLFRDVTQQMHNGTFANISKYYDADDALGTDTLLRTVMDAGVLDEQRFILPLRYNYNVLCVSQAFLESEGITIDDIDGNIDKLYDMCIKHSNTQYAWPLKAIPTYSCFSNLVDYNTGNVVLESKEIADLIGKYIQVEMDAIYSASADDCFATAAFYILEGVHFTEAGYPYRVQNLSTIIDVAATAKASKNELIMAPIRTTSGDLLAEVTYYGAVGAGCAQPKLAYELLRLFLTEEAQWEQYDSRMKRVYKDMFDLSLVEDGYPVRTEGSVAPLYQNMKHYIDSLREQKIENTSTRRKQYMDRNLNMTNEAIPVLSETIDIVRFPIIQEYGDMLSNHITTALSVTEGTADLELLAQQAIDDLQKYIDEG